MARRVPVKGGKEEEGNVRQVFEGLPGNVVAQSKRSEVATDSTGLDS